MSHLLSIRETATRLGMSTDFVKRAVRKGTLQGVRVGRAVRIREDEVAGVVRWGLASTTKTTTEAK